MSIYGDAVAEFQVQLAINVSALSTSTIGPFPDAQQEIGKFPNLQMSGYTMRVRERLVWQQEFQEFAFLCILTDEIDQAGENLAMIDTFAQIDTVLRTNRTLDSKVKWAYVTGYTIVDNPVIQTRTQSLFFETIFELIR